MNHLRIIPLGGLGAIGMNCMVLECAEQFVLIDCGVQFSDPHYPGAEVLTPDLTYVLKNRQRMRGVVVTHAHDDHIGAVAFLARELALDVYCTAFPEQLLVEKFQDHAKLKQVRFHRIEPRKKFRVGPFEFDPIRVQHSIIESLAFAIDTPVGRIIHTGDFKHDPNEIASEKFGFEEFEQIGRTGVRLLMSDSTNAERAGHSGSETDITASFEQIFAQQSGRILIALFASNLRRIEALLWLAHKAGKKVALLGRSMHTYTRIANEQGSISLPPQTLVTIDKVSKYSDDQVVILTTGSQAEPQSALLRIAQASHRDIKIKTSDRIILSSRFIPGNERAITSMIDLLFRLGADVVYDSHACVHVSGHGYADELELMLRAVAPKCFIPIHGSYRHLAQHAKLAVKCGIAPENVCVIENGDVLEFDGKTLVRVESLPMRYGVVINGEFADNTPEPFAARLKLGSSGVVYVSLLRDEQTLALAYPPQVSSYGLVLYRGHDIDDLLDDAAAFIEELYVDIMPKDNIEEILRVELRRFFKQSLTHRPIVIPLVLDLSSDRR